MIISFLLECKFYVALGVNHKKGHLRVPFCESLSTLFIRGYLSILKKLNSNAIQKLV
jgi:hypothetical protein